jgi:hypothetical protein
VVHHPASSVPVLCLTAKAAAAAAVHRGPQLLPRYEAVGLQGLELVQHLVCPSKQTLCSKQSQMSECEGVAMSCRCSSSSSRVRQSSRTHSG